MISSFISDQTIKEMLQNNNTRVLIAYASKHGTTAEIARRIGERIREHGVNVEVDPVRDVKNLCRYDAIILGTAIYFGRWKSEAVKFIKKHRHEFSQKPLWIFLSGPTGEGDPEALVEGLKYPPSMEDLIGDIHPKEIAVFHGALDVDKLGFFEKFIVKKVKAPVGDFRDWEAIDDWARAIAEQISAAAYENNVVV
jgi:menaquinone-dependent protoporphyrinogen oxidase